MTVTLTRLASGRLGRSLSWGKKETPQIGGNMGGKQQEKKRLQEGPIALRKNLKKIILNPMIVCRGTASPDVGHQCISASVHQIRASVE